MIKRLLFMLLTFTALPALAQTGKVEYIGQVLTDATVAVACQANAQALATSALDCAAFQMTTQNYSKVWFVVSHTYAAATVLKVYMDQAEAPQAPWGRMPIGDATPPKVLFTEQYGTWEGISASNAWVVGFNVHLPFTRWRWESTGGTTDVLNITAFGVKR